MGGSRVQAGFLAVVMLAWCAPAWADDAACPRGEGVLVFDYASPQAPLMVVEGAIDGFGPAAVVVDTGAAGPYDVFISEAVAARLGLALSAVVTPADSTAIGPNRQTYRTARLARFQLGSVALTDVTVAVVPMIGQMGAQIGRPVDAIVGAQFLRGRGLAIDYAARRIALTAALGDAATAIAFKLAPRKPLVLVAATVNGQGPFALEIDTGATGTTLSPAAAARAGVAGRGQGQMGGAGGQVAVRIGAARLGLGAVVRDLPVVAISEVMTAISAAAGAPVDGILGGDFFQNTCLAIDYPASRLWLSAPSRGKR